MAPVGHLTRTRWPHCPSRGPHRGPCFTPSPTSTPTLTPASRRPTTSSPATATPREALAASTAKVCPSGFPFSFYLDIHLTVSVLFSWIGSIWFSCFRFGSVSFRRLHSSCSPAHICSLSGRESKQRLDAQRGREAPGRQECRGQHRGQRAGGQVTSRGRG